MWVYSFIFSLLITWLNLFFFAPFFPVWQVNLMLITGLLVAILAGRIPWPLIVFTSIWEGIVLRDPFFGTILAGQIIIWLSIEVLLKTLKPVNTKITALIFVLASVTIFTAALKILSFFAGGSIGLNFILLSILANGSLTLAGWQAVNRIMRATKKWLLVKI